MIVLVSFIVLLKGFPCFHNFSHGESHDFYTSTGSRINAAIIINTQLRVRTCINAYARMRSAALRLYHVLV